MMAWQNEEVEIYYWNATVSLVVEKNNFYSDGQNVTYLMDNDTLAEVFPEMECQTKASRKKARELNLQLFLCPQLLLPKVLCKWSNTYHFGEKTDGANT